MVEKNVTSQMTNSGRLSRHSATKSPNDQSDLQATMTIDANTAVGYTNTHTRAHTHTLEECMKPNVSTHQRAEKGCEHQQRQAN